MSIYTEHAKDSLKIAESALPESIRACSRPYGMTSNIVHGKLSYTGKTVRREKGMQSSSPSISLLPTEERRPPPMTYLLACVSQIAAPIGIL